MVQDYTRRTVDRTRATQHKSNTTHFIGRNRSYSREINFARICFYSEHSSARAMSH